MNDPTGCFTLLALLILSIGAALIRFAVRIRRPPPGYLSPSTRLRLNRSRRQRHPR